MATTTFSGPVISTNGFVGDVIGNVSGDITPTTLILPASTAAMIGDKAEGINTAGKVVGKVVVDLATGLMYTATGVTDVAPWVASDGTTTVTPA